MTAAISSRAEYRPSDYRFARQRTDRLYIPLERTPPVFGADWRDWAAGVATCAFCVTAYCASGILSWLVN